MLVAFAGGCRKYFRCLILYSELIGLEFLLYRSDTFWSKIEVYIIFKEAL